MYTVEFDLKLLTPLYMFGAKPNYLELRTPEFKGMIRFWWRALKCCKNVSKLKEKEEEIFGGTSLKSGKSKVKIMIKHSRIDRNIGSDLMNDYGLDWHYDGKNKSLAGKDRGIGYLFYSMIRKNEKKKIFPKKYFKPGITFKIILYSREEEALKNTVAAFWCAANLGGFGSRARRGAGSLTVVSVVGDTYGLDFVPKGKNSQELAHWILENVSKVSDIIGPINIDCNDYTNIISSSFIVSKESYNTWHDALSDIGKMYMNFRNGMRNNIQNGIFGLPVVHSNKNRVIGKSDKYDKYIINRRSSPLLFKVLECNGKYHWMALKLGGSFLQEDMYLAFVKEEKINGRKEITALENAKPSYALLDKFWDEIKKNNDGDYRFNIRGENL